MASNAGLPTVDVVPFPLENPNVEPFPSSHISKISADEVTDVAFALPTTDKPYALSQCPFDENHHVQPPEYSALLSEYNVQSMKSSLELVAVVEPLVNRVGKLQPSTHGNLKRKLICLKVRLAKSDSLDGRAKFDELIAVNSDLKFLVANLCDLLPHNVLGACLGVVEAGNVASSQ